MPASSRSRLLQADALLIASVARHLTEEFGLSISGIGSLMMVRAFIQALLMPLWGYMADRRSRTALLSVRRRRCRHAPPAPAAHPPPRLQLGIFLWSIDAVLLSQCREVWQLLIVRGLAGVGLSAVPVRARAPRWPRPRHAH